MGWVSLVTETPKIVQKINFSETELELKSYIFGVKYVTSFVPITSYRNEI